jgi:hypothetical protein
MTCIEKFVVIVKLRICKFWDCGVETEDLNVQELKNET